ncbi:hypothetical protein BOX15_Mlig017934g2, partial [Macrostomum lignano]
LNGYEWKQQYMKTANCVYLCTTYKYRFAGLQAIDCCHCGNSYGRYGRAADSECSLSCDGDHSDTCGGHWRNEVYSTGL